MLIDDIKEWANLSLKESIYKGRGQRRVVNHFK